MIAENLSDLFQRYLEVAYDGEQHTAKELPKMIEAVSTFHLRAGFERWAEQCGKRAARIENIFSLLDRAAATETNHTVRGILSESEKMIKHIDRSPLLDSALIMLATQLKHNDIAVYGALASLARLRGYREIAGLLEQSVAEAKVADQELTSLAIGINPEAIGFQNTPKGMVVI